MNNQIPSSWWRDFEKLVFQLLLDEYGIEEDKINKLTQSQKDGGYDGIFFVPCSTNSIDANLDFQKMLFEAKLRGNITRDLPLQDFSKALIISINKNADKLVIATNLYFSQKTIDILQDFSQRTGLDIQYLTASEICYWINKMSVNSVISLSVSEELIHFLENSYQQNKDKISVISPTKDTIASPHYRTELLIGKDRQENCANLVAHIQATCGIFTIEGEAGVGKTVFLNSVLQTIWDKSKYNIRKIDIAYFGTPRLLFLKLLEHVWSIPIEAIESLSNKDIGEAVSWIGEYETPKEMYTAIISAFQEPIETYHQHADVFNYYLVEYLYNVYKSVNFKKKTLLCLTNVDYASEDLISFLLMFLRRVGEKTRIILELRTSLLQINTISDKAWKDFLESVHLDVHLKKQVVLKEWGISDVNAFIQDNITSIHLPTIALRTIRQRIGRNPLNLLTFLTDLNFQIEQEHIPQHYITEYVQNCNILSVNAMVVSVIRRSIQYIPDAAGVYFILGIMSGSVSIKFIEECIQKPVQDVLIWLAENTSMIFCKDSEVYVSHSLYLIAFQKYDYLSESAKQRISRSILNNLPELHMDSFHSAFVSVRLNQILHNHDKAAIYALDLAKQLFCEGQLHKSLHFYFVASSELDLVLSNQFEKQFLSILGQIECKLQIEDFQIKELENDFEDCQAYLDAASISEEKREEYQIHLLLAQGAFLHNCGAFRKSLEVSRQTLRRLYRTKVPDLELLGKAWSIYCIAVKETSSLTRALPIFEKAERVCAASNLHFSHLTHQAAFFSSFSSKQAMRCFEEISLNDSKLSLAERIHNQVNLVTMQFYCGMVETAAIAGSQLLKQCYITRQINEEGRISNLLGCIELYSGNQKAAKEHFNHGMKIFNHENYVAYVWPLFINSALMHFIDGDFEKAVDYIVKCVTIFRENYALRIRNTPKVMDTYEKLHIAVLLAAGILKDSVHVDFRADALLQTIYCLSESSVIDAELQRIHSYEDVLVCTDRSTYNVGKFVLIKD